MTTDFNGREPDITPTDGDAPLFAAQPVWDRARNKKRFGARKAAPLAAPAAPPPAAPMANAAPEPRSFAPTEPSPTEPAMILDRPAPSATVTHSTLAAEEAPMMAAPIGETRNVKVRNAGPSPAVLAGAVAAVALIGLGGWYLARPHDGVPELAPGQPTTSELAAAPIVTPEQPREVDVATNTLRQRAAPPVRAERQASAARVRPAARAAAPSASDNSANVSATLPDAPQAYANPAIAPTQVTPAAPAPTEASPPAAIPTTPPVATPEAPAPVETPTPPSA